jgi:LysR family hydrogen peroxide-inducible transcriptional activator
MEMHQLRYFVAVAQTGSFSRAAEQCHVSQPSLSQQIQKLERGLSQHLFDRLGRRALLTDAGRLLLDRALAILATVEDAERRLREADDRPGGRLAIGAIPTIAPYLLPLVLGRFLKDHPLAEVTIHEDVTRQLLTAVVAGEVDLALVALPISDDRVQAEALFTEPLLLALPRAHRLAGRRRITVEDVGAERFILLNEMHCLGDQVLSFCNAHGCQPWIACRSAQITTVQALIALNQGISLLPAMAQRVDRDKRRVYRALAGDPPRRTIAVIWRLHRYHSPTAERFLVSLRELAGHLPASATPRARNGASRPPVTTNHGPRVRG